MRILRPVVLILLLQWLALGSTSVGNTLEPLLTPRLHGGTPKVTEKVYSEHVEDEQWSSWEKYNGE
jgi:hypothetical protein